MGGFIEHYIVAKVMCIIYMFLYNTHNGAKDLCVV